jgi:hypothetical protein
MPMPLAQFVGVQGARTGASRRAYSRTLFSARESTDAGTGGGRSGYRQLVTMLLPERTAVATMTTYGLPGRHWYRRESEYHHY